MNMPNWTHNVVTITGDAKTIAEIKALVQSDDTAFDFGKIIPIPESLLVESGGMESIAMEMASSAPYSIARENAREKMQKNASVHSHTSDKNGHLRIKDRR